MTNRLEGETRHTGGMAGYAERTNRVGRHQVAALEGFQGRAEGFVNPGHRSSPVEQGVEVFAEESVSLVCRHPGSVSDGENTTARRKKPREVACRRMGP